MFFAMGLNVRWGWAGDLDLSIFVYVAIGAYVTAVSVVGPSTLPPPDHYILGLHWPFLVGVLAGMGVAAVVALAFGAIGLRTLRGDYFAIVTVSFTLVVYAFISQFVPLFDGFQGITGIPQPFSSVIQLSADQYATFYLIFCILVLLVVYLILNALFHSAFGRGLRAIRDDEVAAQAFGRDVYRNKLKAYVLGGTIGALGGGLYVGFLGTWSPVRLESIRDLSNTRVNLDRGEGE